MRREQKGVVEVGVSVCAKDGVKFQNRTVQTRSYLSGLICAGKHEVEASKDSLDIKTGRGGDRRSFGRWRV